MTTRPLRAALSLALFLTLPILRTARAQEPTPNAPPHPVPISTEWLLDAAGQSSAAQ